uniref:Uncharacterized protein LOC111107008 isoform X2 n=1 Tax=Crassostrea virginica TaxID=6565 RepID=A0A8B8B4Q0_CRAVI|nr:uncharacterized protein LOC111107008 isoform X2 [Crassostrea virginica]
MALHTISESVYVGLCRTYMIGKPQQVAIRRNLIDITELLKQKATSKIGHPVQMFSGSLRDGFRFRDSDVDIMFWAHDYKVLWDFSQATLYSTQRYKLILSDSSESPPGFTLLWLPLETADRYVLSSCVRINGSLCISSTMYRDYMQTLKPGSTVHGPCCSGREVGKIGRVEMEWDYADCFVSDFWPPSASSWIDRCHSWPPPHVVDDIIRSGCHFVAIGHKLGKHADNEWRVSFSQAEQKLVHIDPMRAQAALDDLQVLVHHDQGVFVPVHFRDISWEILGICQQMTGNHQAALYSYRQSLRELPHNKIHTATRQRIQDLH